MQIITNFAVFGMKSNGRYFIARWSLLLLEDSLLSLRVTPLILTLFRNVFLINQNNRT